MEIQVNEIPRETVDTVVHDLNTTGYACVPNYLSSSDLARLQGFVNDAIANSNGEYVHFKGLESLTGSGFDEIGNSPTFRNFLYDLYERGTGRKRIDQAFYSVLRCLSGSTGRDHSYHFHYDAYMVTALIPIHIPTEGIPGDLLMYPNTRGLRKHYVTSLVDKVLLQNKLTQGFLKSRVNAKFMKPMRIKMQPGNLYLFWGYRSIHTNEPCDPDKVRATALFHYANPHADGYAVRDRILNMFGRPAHN
jgi:hypothetical protein